MGANSARQDADCVFAPETRSNLLPRLLMGCIISSSEIAFRSLVVESDGLSLSIVDDHTQERVAELFCTFSDTSKAGEIFRSAATNHLRALRHPHLVRARGQGKEVCYSVTDLHIVNLFRHGMEHVRDDSAMARFLDQQPVHA